MDGDNVYEVDVIVIDNAGARGVKNVRVEVMNMMEDGEVALSPDQPNIMAAATASLSDDDGIMTESDGEETITEWQWYWTESAITIGYNAGRTQVVRIGDDDSPTNDVVATSTTDAVGDVLAGASSDTYMPGEDDIGRYLHVMVRYRDGENTEDDPVTDFDERDDADNDSTTNAEGQGADLDRVIFKRFPNAVQAMGSGGDGATTSPDTVPMFADASPVITVPENTPSTGYVGGSILGMDDGGEMGLEYEIGGPNASRFFLAELTTTKATDELYFNDMDADADPAVDDDRDSGRSQIAIAPVTHLDADDAANDTYRVEVTATDAEGQRATAMVTIVVTDVNEAPSAPRGFSAAARPMNTAPAFAEGASTTRDVAENTAAGMDIGAPVTATDTDRPAQVLTYTLGGADMASFAIDSATGQLMTKAALDFEMKSEYMVDVTAMDDEEAPATISVTISVMDVMLGEPGDTYDTDSNERISRSEVIGAIRDFLFAQTITKEQVIDVIRLYLTR